MKIINLKKNIFFAKDKKTKGFTLLFAVLVSVVVLSVSLSIISISVKQIILSSVGKESQYAFYAANSALECALYWDNHSPEPGTYVFPQVDKLNQQSVSRNRWDDVKCAGMSIMTGAGAPAGNDFIQDYDFYVGVNNINRFAIAFNPNVGDGVDTKQLCAEVFVSKSEVEQVGSVYKYTTTIVVQGYSSCDIDNPRTVQRGLVIEYER